MRRLALLVPFLLLVACDQNDDAFLYPPADLALPSITLDALRNDILEPGAYTTRGSVDAVFACPPCPPNMDCAPCPPEGVRFIDPDREIGRQGVFVAMTDASPFVGGGTYHISVEVDVVFPLAEGRATLIGATRIEGSR